MKLVENIQEMRKVYKIPQFETEDKRSLRETSVNGWVILQLIPKNQKCRIWTEFFCISIYYVAESFEVSGLHELPTCSTTISSRRASLRSYFLFSIFSESVYVFIFLSIRGSIIRLAPVCHWYFITILYYCYYLYIYIYLCFCSVKILKINFV